MGRRNESGPWTDPPRDEGRVVDGQDGEVKVNVSK